MHAVFKAKNQRIFIAYNCTGLQPYSTVCTRLYAADGCTLYALHFTSFTLRFSLLGCFGHTGLL